MCLNIFGEKLNLNVKCLRRRLECGKALYHFPTEEYHLWNEMRQLRYAFNHILAGWGCKKTVWECGMVVMECN